MSLHTNSIGTAYPIALLDARVSLSGSVKTERNTQQLFTRSPVQHGLLLDGFAKKDSDKYVGFIPTTERGES